MMNQKRKTALVLSGGGALGTAHIGVIKILEKQGYEFDFYSGVSAGSIIISLLAIGYNSAEIWEIVERTNIFSAMFDISKSRFGLVQGDKVVKLFKKYLEDQRIEDLEVPLAIGATDFSNGQRVMITKGSLVDAIRASISVPVLFEPYFHPVEEKWLVDGGLSQNFPLDYAIDQYSGNNIIGVDVASSLSPDFLFFDHKKNWKGNNIKQVFERVLRIYLSNQQIHFPQDNRVQIIRPQLHNYTASDIFKLKEIYQEGAKTAEDFLVAKD